MNEARSKGRSRAMLGAHIIYNNKKSTLDCQIRNISETGARLAMSETVALPDEFELQVPHRARTYKARLRWRTGDSVGVELLDGEKSAAGNKAAAESRDRLAELEAENAALRAQVETLNLLLAEQNKALKARAA